MIISNQCHLIDPTQYVAIFEHLDSISSVQTRWPELWRDVC